MSTGKAIERHYGINSIYVATNFRYRINQNKKSFDIIICDDGEYKTKNNRLFVTPYLNAYGYDTKSMKSIKMTEFSYGCYRIKSKTTNPQPLREFNPEWFDLPLPAYESGREIEEFCVRNIPLNSTIKWYKNEDFEAFVIAPHDNALLDYEHFEKRYGDKLEKMGSSSCEFNYGKKLPSPLSSHQDDYRCFATSNGETVLLKKSISPLMIFSSVNVEIKKEEEANYDIETLKGICDMSVKKYIALKEYCNSLEKENESLRKLISRAG